MPRLPFLAAVLLLALNASAQRVTPELPVSMQPVPDSNTGCSVISGATKAFALCGAFGGPLYRVDLAGDGKPLLPTRALLDPACCFVAVGDTLYSAAAGLDTVVVRRADSGAQAQIAAPGSSTARLTWNGGSLLLLTYNSGGATMAAILDTSLSIVVRPFSLFGAPIASVLPATASADGRFLVVALGAKNATTGTIVDPDGTTHAIDLKTPPTASNAWDALASSGTDYLHVWERDLGPLVAQRYSSSGEPVGELQTIALNPTRGIALQSAVWNGHDYVIVWTNDSVAWMQTLGGAPQLIGDGAARIAAGPAGVFLIQRRSFAPQTIRRFDTGGPQYTLSYGDQYQWYAAVATDGIETAAVWNEGHLVRIGRIAADGAHLDGAGAVLPIDVGDTIEQFDLVKHVQPAIAFDGVRYLVVWIAQKHVNGVFFGPNGAVGAAFVIADAKYEDAPSVVWDGAQYVVTWSHGGYFGNGAFVTTSGAVTPFRFGTDVGEVSASAVGPRTLVVYANYAQGLYWYLYAVFLDAAGSPFTIASDQALQWGLHRSAVRPRVVTNGRDYLVTWTMLSGNASEAWVAKMDDRGHLIGTPFVVASTNPGRPTANAIPLFDGTDYRVVVSGAPGMPLFAAKVTDGSFACGCLDDTVAIPIDFDFPIYANPIVAAAGHGTIVVGYERWFAKDPVYGSYPRVMLRVVRPLRRRAAAE